MGRVKQWALEQEDHFMDKMLEVAQTGVKLILVSLRRWKVTWTL